MVPIRFKRMGHGRVIKTLDIQLGGGRCSWDSEARVRSRAPTHEAILFAYSWDLPCCQYMETCPHMPSIHNDMTVSCKQFSGESFLLRIHWLLCSMLDTVQLAPIRFWRMGYGRSVKTLGITVGGGRCPSGSETRVRNRAPTREAICS